MCLTMFKRFLYIFSYWVIQIPQFSLLKYKHHDQGSSGLNSNLDSNTTAPLKRYVHISLVKCWVSTEILKVLSVKFNLNL